MKRSVYVAPTTERFQIELEGAFMVGSQTEIKAENSRSIRYPTATKTSIIIFLIKPLKQILDSRAPVSLFLDT